MIDRTQPIAPIAASQSSHDLHPRPSLQPTNKEASPAAQKTSVTLSTLTHQIHNDNSQDIDHAKVAEFKAALAAGTLALDTEKVAQAMVPYLIQPH